MCAPSESTLCALECWRNVNVMKWWAPMDLCRCLLLCKWRWPTLSSWQSGREKKNRSKLSCEAWRSSNSNFPLERGAERKHQWQYANESLHRLCYIFIIVGDTRSSVHLNPPELLVNFHYNQSIRNGRLINSRKSIDEGAAGPMPNIRKKCVHWSGRIKFIFFIECFSNAGVHRHNSE